MTPQDQMSLALAEVRAWVNARGGIVARLSYAGTSIDLIYYDGGDDLPRRAVFHVNDDGSRTLLSHAHYYPNPYNREA